MVASAVSALSQDGAVLPSTGGMSQSSLLSERFGDIDVSRAFAGSLFSFSPPSTPAKSSRDGGSASAEFASPSRLRWMSVQKHVKAGALSSSTAAVAGGGSAARKAAQKTRFASPILMKHAADVRLDDRKLIEREALEHKSAAGAAAGTAGGSSAAVQAAAAAAEKKAGLASVLAVDALSFPPTSGHNHFKISGRPLSFSVFALCFRSLVRLLMLAFAASASAAAPRFVSHSGLTQKDLGSVRESYFLGSTVRCRCQQLTMM